MVSPNTTQINIPTLITITRSGPVGEGFFENRYDPAKVEAVHSDGTSVGASSYASWENDKIECVITLTKVGNWQIKITRDDGAVVFSEELILIPDELSAGGFSFGFRMGF
ncbi:MAG TPA: hypothetical protein PLE24_02460 [Chitinispirillaceae bacterium]|jgi:hypothetical protein|nr:hypothetical protein [Chitinispirillaceae bacterium]